MSSVFAHTLAVPADETFSPPVDALSAPQATAIPSDLAPSANGEALPVADDSPKSGTAASETTLAPLPSVEGSLRADSALTSGAPLTQASSTQPTRSISVGGGAAGAVLLIGGLTAFALMNATRPTPTTSDTRVAVSGSRTRSPHTNPATNQESGGQPPFTLPLLGLTPQPSLDLAPKTSLNGSTPSGTPSVSPQSPAARLFAKATELQKQGKPDEAAAAYRAVIKLQPKAASAWINLAILLLQNKQPAQAIEPLRRATQLEPKNPALRQQLVRTLIALKRPQEALVPLQELARLQPKDGATHTMLAQMLQQGGKTREAYDQWVLLTTLDAQNPIPPFYAGMLAAQALHKPAEAETYLRRSFDLQSKPGQKITDPRAPLALAQVLMARGKVPDAIKVCEAGIKQFPQVLALHTQLADARLAAKDLPGAIQATRDALKVVPPQMPNEIKARLHAGLGQMLLNNQQVKEGIVELRTASQLVPKNQKLAELLKQVEAQSKANLGQPAPTGPNAEILKKARDLGRAGKWDAAAQAYAIYNSTQKNDVGGLSEYAFVQEQRKSWKEAEQLWAQVATLQPKSPIPHLHRYEALIRIKRQPDALIAIRRAYELAPNDPDILLRLADSEAFAGNFSVSRDRMQKLLTLQPNFAQGYGALAEVAIRSKDIKPAVDFLQKQIAKHPTRTEAYGAILQAYDGMGQGKQGREIVKSWIERDKKNKAPRTALDAFDLFKAKQELQAGIQQDRERLKNHPVPSATPAKTPAPAPPAKPETAPEKTAEEMKPAPEKKE